MANSDFPQEILMEIFSRLPTKSVGKCRCLAKPWRTLLSTPEFIKSHLTQKPHQESLVLITPSHSIHSIADITDDAVSKKLDLPIHSSEVVGSCDGLVLLVNEDYGKFLVNPITLQLVEIPDSPVALKKDESFSMYGFGYDRFSDDYKVVALSYYNTDNEYEPDCIDTFVDVYSAKTGVWKRVDNSTYDHAVPSLSSGAFVNGAIHWLTSSRELNYPSVIVAFSFVDEVFDEIPAPGGVDVQKFVFNKLVAVEGCLCMIDIGTNSRADIWIMKEYGLRESWTKFSVDADCDSDIVKAICFIGDDDVVLLTEWESLVVYNMKEKRLRDMIVDEVPATFIDGGTFVDSLISPAFRDT